MCLGRQKIPTGLPTQVSGDFTSVLRDLIPEVITNQKCYMNSGPILSGNRCG
jgi:hypothetical protein